METLGLSIIRQVRLKSKCKSWKGLTEDIKNDKIIQVLAYAFMYEHEANGNQ
jgi:hypothetical protein